MAIEIDEHGRKVVKRETHPRIGENRPRIYLYDGASLARDMIEEDEPEMDSLRLGQGFKYFHQEI